MPLEAERKRGLCPRTPGIYRFEAIRRWAAARQAAGHTPRTAVFALVRRSGCVPAEPYPPNKCAEPNPKSLTLNPKIQPSSSRIA